MPGIDPRDRDAELDAQELERREAQAELERIRRDELAAEARAKADRLEDLEAQAREDDAEHAAAGVGRDGEAGPLADHVRARMRDVVAKLATVRMQPGDFRDVSIGLAALGASLEDVERADGRRWLHEARLRAIAADLKALLELVGEPDGHGEAVERAYWPVREDLDELLELAGDARATLNAGEGGGLLARLARAEAELGRARDLVAQHRGDRDSAGAAHDRTRALVAEHARRLADGLSGIRSVERPLHVVDSVREQLLELAGHADEATLERMPRR